MILRPFDPWESPSCTCPAKLSLNPYTGCQHGCLYCYATSYIPRFWECRPKADLQRRLAREAARVEPGALVAMSNSSDPYPPLEKDLRLTRRCLQVLKENDLLVQVVTKSHLVARDADLLCRMQAVVAITVTTLCESLSRRLEPGAPLPEARLDALRALREAGVAVSARIDPIIPGINDSEIEDLVTAVARAGAMHITSSTYKARPDSLRRICSAFPEEGRRLIALFSGERRTAGGLRLPGDMRAGLMGRVKEIAIREGATFASCREDLVPMPYVNCDGSHLLQRRIVDGSLWQVRKKSK